MQVVMILKGKALFNHQAASFGNCLCLWTWKGFIWLVQQNKYIFTQDYSPEQLLRCNHDNYDCTWIVLATWEERVPLRWLAILLGFSLWISRKKGPIVAIRQSIFENNGENCLETTWKKSCLWAGKLLFSAIFYIIEDTKEEFMYRGIEMAGTVNPGGFRRVGKMTSWVAPVRRLLPGFEILTSRNVLEQWALSGVIRAGGPRHDLFGIPRSKRQGGTAEDVQFFHLDCPS